MCCHNFMLSMMMTLQRLHIYAMLLSLQIGLDWLKPPLILKFILKDKQGHGNHFIELDVDPGDFTSDTSETSNPTINQDCEGEEHSEAVSNVELPHDTTKVNKGVTFSDNLDMRSITKVVMSIILNQRNGECLIKSTLITVVYDALLNQQY
jgi:hypothetical protein